MDFLIFPHWNKSCTFEGDDLDNDYYGALNMCWNSLLVDRWGGGYTTIDEDQVVGNIMEIFQRNKL